MRFIDTNIFLELELGQERVEACEEFLQKVAEGKRKAMTNNFVLDSIVVVMEAKGKSWREIRKFLSSILAFEGLVVYHLNHFDRIRATEFMRLKGLDYDDSLAYQTMRTNDLKKLVSFDDDFDRLEDIKRVEP